jgi:hypothetical protein
MCTLHAGKLKFLNADPNLSPEPVLTVTSDNGVFPVQVRATQRLAAEKRQVNNVIKKHGSPIEVEKAFDALLLLPMLAKKTCRQARIKGTSTTARPTTTPVPLLAWA